MTTFLAKNNLLPWLEGLRESRTLVAPVRLEGLTLFRPVSSTQEIVLDYAFTDLSPKDWFFPPSEAIFTAQRKDGHLEITPRTMEREAVLFGMHPCDGLGIALLDKVFLAEPADALYQEKRSKTALVGLACKRACPECFCTSLGSGPQDSRYLDIMFTEVEGGYIVQAITEKGKALLSSAKTEEKQVSPPPPPAVNTVPTEGITEVARRVFDSPYWDRLADRCIHCNMCAFVCPACYCFDMRDYSSRGVMERVRSWESCQSPGFTRLAGGYNPRSGKGARLRQRFYHKFLYFPEQLGAIGCTGCGRCVRACPVNIDIREIITQMQSLGAAIGSAEKK